MHDIAFTNARIATMREGGAPWGAIEDGVVAVDGDRIAWVGPRGEWRGKAREERDARGAWITPGLVDCHTHLVYAGNRANEFEMRLNGATYEDISRAGGGIASTVRATRAASEDELLASAARRLGEILAEGATTVEVKSGYGLDVDTEARMLRVARRLGTQMPVTVKTTFLGAHALAPEFAGRKDDYIDFVCAAAMPAVARENLADAVDAFCEDIGFTPAQTARVFDAARALGLPVKLHADQRMDSGGAALAARHEALSADHVEFSTDDGARKMAGAGTVAVLLPGAVYFLRETQLPPVAAFRRHGTAMALATDCNPGSSPLTSPLLVLNLACTLLRLTPEEALAGMTRNGAKALGLQATQGTLEAGKAADFVLWDIGTPAELAYAIGANPRVLTVQAGRPVLAPASR